MGRQVDTTGDVEKTRVAAMHAGPCNMGHTTMLKNDVRLLETALRSTLGLTLKRAREILTSSDNDWRIRLCRSTMTGCVLVPDAVEPVIVIHVPREDGTLRFADVIRVCEGDLAKWRALPEADRAPPANMPVAEPVEAG